MVAKKKKFKLPNWLINTLEMTVMVAILMALYNFLGPMVFKNGSYFPWWTFPYSVVGALFLIGGWNFLSHRMNIMHNQIVAEDNAKKERAERIRREGAAKERVEAEKRRQRNANRNRNNQQSR
ncbi:hypothetical protein B8W93_01335 [Lentilactobacillus kefiri]|nr:hypothetical protein [Lentilactobacillus kefiri]PAK60247.1 hypothetical protein B9K02_02390 [Lentilactobacillus kefiri]PAK84125.1 hypothetical protein B8W85_01440 [Lentilactobacillus kefiri]PAL07563.1 hypothetical protein B8W93_01335 [Lentilactobacillus kefiri]QGV25101.1 hypothetical protein DNL43_07395 [Lentilactobacillus kefiri]